jgi:hypothetical protein
MVLIVIMLAHATPSAAACRKIMAGALSGPTVDHFLSALARECNKENQQGRGAATPGGTKWDGAAAGRWPG